MKQLFCPWRHTYTVDNGRSKQEDTTAQECVFCVQLSSNQDAQHLILKRYTYHAVMLNKYPYNAGHLLIIPYAHVKDLNSLEQAAQYELIRLIADYGQFIRSAMSADGLNVGFNIGKAAGAGIPSHMHTHILPRFLGDTNFLPALADTKNIPFDLNHLYAKLQAQLP